MILQGVCMNMVWHAYGRCLFYTPQSIYWSCPILAANGRLSSKTLTRYASRRTKITVFKNLKAPKNPARGNRKTLKSPKTMSKINFKNLKLQSHEEYLICRTFFVKSKTWFSSKNAKLNKANETIEWPVIQILRQNYNEMKKKFVTYRIFDLTQTQ